MSHYHLKSPLPPLHKLHLTQLFFWILMTLIRLIFTDFLEPLPIVGLSLSLPEDAITGSIRSWSVVAGIGQRQARPLRWVIVQEWPLTSRRRTHRKGWVYLKHSYIFFLTNNKKWHFMSRAILLYINILYCFIALKIFKNMKRFKGA